MAFVIGVSRYRIFPTFRNLLTEFEGMEDKEGGGGEQARKLAELNCCPTCNHNCGGALYVRRHLQTNHGCLEETRCTLDQFMCRLHSKKKMLTRDKERHLQYKRQKVSAI